ncbi:MAG: epoxyqueuosine reductase QueH [Oscillospiraceae bacterium]|nr:epoxyqueuosine reductase QueH [Oscillospiraceae bacterium]
MNKNYQRELDALIAKLEPSSPPHLLLHSCCAPCSSYTLEYLSRYFRITLLYYNPNIFPAEEYYRRCEEQQTLIGKMSFLNPVSFLEGKYDPKTFYKLAKGFENEPECGERCTRCYKLRLHEAAITARSIGADYFTTTLTISPHKDAHRLNSIGERFAKQYGIALLPSDFKKKNGFKRSIELSQEYGLYRQDYCGCEFSKISREKSENDNICK